MSESTPMVTIPLADYQRLLDAAECDDTIVRCEVCGAWMDQDDEAVSSTEGFISCWAFATGREKEAHLCRKERARVGKDC